MMFYLFDFSFDPSIFRFFHIDAIFAFSIRLMIFRCFLRYLIIIIRPFIILLFFLIKDAIHDVSMSPCSFSCLMMFCLLIMPDDYYRFFADDDDPDDMLTLMLLLCSIIIPSIFHFDYYSSLIIYYSLIFFRLLLLFIIFTLMPAMPAIIRS